MLLRARARSRSCPQAGPLAASPARYAGGHVLALGAVASADIVAVSIFYDLTGPVIGVVYAVLSLLRH